MHVRREAVVHVHVWWRRWYILLMVLEISWGFSLRDLVSAVLGVICVNYATRGVFLVLCCIVFSFSTAGSRGGPDLFVGADTRMWIRQFEWGTSTLTGLDGLVPLVQWDRLLWDEGYPAFAPHGSIGLLKRIIYFCGFFVLIVRWSCFRSSTRASQWPFFLPELRSTWLSQRVCSLAVVNEMMSAVVDKFLSGR